MDVYILDKNFATIAVVDTYISLIWTDRLYKCGDFEMRVPITRTDILYKLRPYQYLYCKRSEHLMVIEHIQLDTHHDEIVCYVLKGRSMESFLDRRVLFGGLTFDETKVPVLLQQVLKENILNPTEKNRKAPLVVRDFPESMNDLTYSGEYDGHTVLDVFSDVLGSLGYGFKILLEGNDYVLTIYEGVNRTYGQTKESWKVFSPKFNNLLKTNFVFDVSDSGNAAIVCGEDASQTTNPTTGQVFYWPQMWIGMESEKTGEGWDRVETFVDCSDVSRWQGDYIFGTTEMKPPEYRTHGWKKLQDGLYRKILEKKATERMQDRGPEIEFDAEVDTNIQWRLGRDIFLGDLVEILNEYNIGCQSRVTEITMVFDSAGQKIYPTFEGTGDVYFVNLEKGDTEDVWPLHMDSIIRSTTTESTTLRNS